jgi:DNA-binding XRE family transcriptional regulator
MYKNKLREIRFFGNIKQCELAIKAGVPLATLSKIENGWLRPNEDQKRRIANALALPVHDVFPGKE